MKSLIQKIKSKFLIREIRAKLKPGQEKGDLHFQRWRILPFKAPWELFNVYIHIMYKSSKLNHCHDHPWWFISLVLWGSYTEKRIYNILTEEDGGVVRVHATFPEYNKRGFFSLAYMNTEDFHDLHEVHKKTVTLVLTGKRKREWGYYLDEENRWISANDYANYKQRINKK